MLRTGLMSFGDGATHRPLLRMSGSRPASAASRTYRQVQPWVAPFWAPFWHRFGAVGAAAAICYILRMARPACRPGTYEDLLALPEHLVGELVDGELIVSPRPAARHARSTSGLDRTLGSSFDGRGTGPGGWWILPEVELHLGRNVLVPDLAGWRREHLPRCPSGPFVEVAPAWVCEVLSPSNAAVDRKLKLPRYAQAGVAHVWLVDPAARTLEVLEREGPRWILWETFSGDDKPRAVPFDAIELDLSALWLPDDDAP